MSGAVTAKICGINDADALAAAVAGGAALLGFNFYPPSPRALSPDAAGALTRLVPEGVRRVGLFVDAADEAIAEVLAAAELDLLQFHGDESVARVARARARFGLPVAKAIKVATREDVEAAHAYEAAADLLLFDAKAPTSMRNALPGGNALVFDWNLLAGHLWQRPWMLSGGLDAGNVAEAVRISGATSLDVSSGVERAPGDKDPALIKAFLDVIRTL